MFSLLMENVASFAQGHTLAAILLGLGLLYFLYRKPKSFLGLLLLGLLLVGVYQMVMNLGGSGSEQKKRLIQEEKQKASDNF
jgi:hypothetical protein